MKKPNPVLPRLIQFGGHYYMANPCMPDLYSIIPAVRNVRATLVSLAGRGLLFRTKGEAVLHATSLVSPGVALVRQMSQDSTSSDDDGEDAYDEDDDDDTCAMCDGTGEGQFDGQRCPCCKGKGY